MMKTKTPLYLLTQIEELLKSHSYNLSPVCISQHDTNIKSSNNIDKNTGYYFFSESDTEYFTPSLTIKALDIDKTSHFTFESYLLHVTINIVNEKHKNNEKLLKIVSNLMLSLTNENIKISKHVIKTSHHNNYKNMEVLFTYNTYLYYYPNQK
ncbi:hypothetical protein [Candidatus Fokinia crypta]|uniref:hypothetical protein n=1 Tax=Candidatus Fokinia crypta TaxID=1920990 RepID=UPI002B26115E|nr:hypothetical protein [Candidatus Fokinia cryptica]